MGTTSTYTVKADLNGTGTLVDITTYVDYAAGVTSKWGRSDWTTANQPPGTLTLTLENLDGRFTPGSTTVYTVGVVKNMCVEWTVDARIRRFYVQTPALRFDASVAGQSKVTLQCADALALLANRQMRSILAETTLLTGPVAYWPLDDGGTDGDNTLCREISSKVQAPLYPFRKISGVPASRGVADGSTVQFGGARGPRTDGAACVMQHPGTTPVATNITTNWRGGVRNRLVTTAPVTGNTFPNEPVVNNNITLPDLTVPIPWATITPSFPNSGWNAPVAHYDGIIWAVGFWFSVKDIYGATSVTTLLTDGPYVHLLTIHGPELGIYWRIPDRRIVILANTLVTGGSAAQAVVLSTDSYSVTVTDTHYLVVTFKCTDPNMYSGAYSAFHTQGTMIKGYLDGVALTANVVAVADITAVPVGLTTGTPVDYFPATTGTTQTIDAHTGSISHVALYGPDPRGLTNTFLVAPTFDNAAAIWNAGSTGPVEDAGARFLRLASFWTGTPALGFSVQGTAAPTMALGPATTTGKSMLSAMCQALATEEASLDTLTIAGVDTVRAYLDSTQRPLTSTITVDVSADCEGGPELSYDASGVAVSVTGHGWNMAVTYTDPAAPTRYLGSTADVTADVSSIASLALFTQYRTIKGRVSKVTPTKITVDAVTSKNNLTATLLTLRPGHVVTVSGLPSQLGYSSIDCVIIGCQETHTLGRALFTLSLMPRPTELYCDPLLSTEGPWRLVDPVPWRQCGSITGPMSEGTFCYLAGANNDGVLSSGATTGYILTNYYHLKAATPGDEGNSAFFSTDSADYPISIMVDSEIITLPNAPAAPAVAGSFSGSHNVYYQTVTGMLRGQAGTTAAAHSSASTLDSRGVAADQGLHVVYLPENEPLLAF